MKLSKISWFNKERFYTLTSIVSSEDDLLFTRIGANDPDFNLRRDPGFMIRKKNSKDTYFISLLESHGHYDPVSEIATNAFSSIKNLKITYSDDDYIAINIETGNDEIKAVFVFI